ncbi:hypothetical protein HMPREF9012_1906 [Bacteroidetes bacterium oral taxon 272 str. F0290]|nr:hypothetical protein HMPREF9012_1906 [Bacteroidetes bacterium oral taxon 272 str. F0290]
MNESWGISVESCNMPVSKFIFRFRRILFSNFGTSQDRKINNFNTIV